MNMRRQNETPADGALFLPGELENLSRHARGVRGSPGESQHWFAAIRSELARCSAACGVFEWVALGYLALSATLAALLSHHLAHPWKLVSTQAMVAATIFFLCAAFERSEQRAIHAGSSFGTAFWHFWRHWYPHLFFLFCFEELAYLVHLIDPGWQDSKLIAFDHWLVGVHPAVWLEQFSTPWRNDFFQLVYLTYFVYLLVLGGILYYRREWHAYWSVMTYSIVGYVVGYLIAVLFPIESPWFAMAGMWHGDLDGGPFTATINFIEHYGRVRGAAFPSAHVTGAVAAVWGCWRFRRWLFWIMLPLVAAMCLSTIWGRYHYIADVFGGILTGTLGYFIGSWLMDFQKGPARSN